MPNKRLYYYLKPYLPWRLRMGLRRIVARRKLERSEDVWPINEAAGRSPEGWPGWPDGKKFAFVITHDVEGARGLAKCRQLMQFEKKLGFRASFNFIPEGGYRVSPELREELAQNGFEVGVHDLRHDGKLYWTRRGFSRYAKRINHYVKEWKASGFRSGFMLHNLDWLHDLNVKYDASTFDTDPFEPQPGGVNTIFPFWLSNENGGGYVELPYTLPQDSTLFLLLGERSPDIWKKKLDWIVERGGMALINVHPDYVKFGGSGKAPHEYPCDYYQEFLEYVRDKYANLFWQPLPREMAEFASTVRPLKRKVSQRRICMISHSDFQTDNRVMRYAVALAERNDIVEVISIKSNPKQSDVEKVGRVRVLRPLSRLVKNQKGKAGYLLPLLKFWLVSSFQLTRRHLKNRYDLVHVHNVPDFLAFTAWLPKLTGAKVILDIHDIVPEFYASKFHLKSDSFGVRVLEKVERFSAWFADHVIISNHLWHKTFVKRSVPEKKCSVFINHVSQNVFYRRLSVHRRKNKIIMFPGGLQWHQGLDIVIRAMPAILKQMPGVEFHIYGDGNMKGELVALTKELGLTQTVRFFEPMPLIQIAEVMSGADVGVVPKRADSFGNEAYSTKIMEFMSLGVPVVASSTKIDRFYFDDSVVRFFESGNEEALAKAILDILQNDELRQRMIASALDYAARNSWEVRKKDYLRLVDSLIAGDSEIPPASKNDLDIPSISPVKETEHLVAK